MQGNSYPGLACGVRLFWDEVRQQHFLLFPEGAIRLNRTAYEILQRCDRRHTIDEIIAELANQFESNNIANDVHQLIEQVVQKGLLKTEIK